MDNPVQVFKVFAASSGFFMVAGCSIGHGYTPSSEHLYGWTAFWLGCCCVCTHFRYPWPFVGSMIAWHGVFKNLGMLWSSYPLQPTQPKLEVWSTWIAGLILTALATSSAFYRITSASWTRDMTSEPISLGEEAA